MAGIRTPYSLLPPVVKTLLILNGLLFVLEMFYIGPLIYWLALWPIHFHSHPEVAQSAPQFIPYQLITYAFLHGSVMHLVLNMYALWLFGTRMENFWGTKLFVFYYFVCVIGAGVIQLLVASPGANPAEYNPTIGASGGVFGLLLAFGMTFPNERLMLLFPPVALKAKTFVILYGAVELWFGVVGAATGIAHFAHLGGMLFGYLLIAYWRKYPPV